MFNIEELSEIPVVRVTNFLPADFIERFFAMMEEIQAEFAFPDWSSKYGKPVAKGRSRKSLCIATDVWFPKTCSSGDGGQLIPWVPSLLYELIEDHMFHQGLTEFFSHTRQEVFRLIPGQTPDGKIHIITYGDGGLYSWHKDGQLPGGPYMFGESPPRNNLFTFSLNLCSCSSMKGGDLLFMRDNRTILLPFTHNSMTVFPASVSHAATEVSMDGGEDWQQQRISCQFWMAGSQFLHPRDYEKFRWPAGAQSLEATSKPT